MTREQVSAATEHARALERLRVWAGSSDDDQAIISEIEQSHEEWLRIAVLMAARRMTTYQLEGDPLVRLQIFAASAARKPEGLPKQPATGIPAPRRPVVPNARGAAER